MPVVRSCRRIPSPIRRLEILKENARFFEASWRIAPDVEFALRCARRRLARTLKPAVLIRGMIDHEFGDHPELAAMRLGKEILEVLERSVNRMDRKIVRDIISIITHR